MHSKPSSVPSPSLWTVSLRSGVLIGCLGGLAWITGKPFIFPSLGPTAFVLSYRPEASALAWQVIGGHLWGTMTGLTCYHLLASGVLLTELAAPMSAAGLHLAISGALATGLTAALMIGTRSVHPPACATTLIVSLGLLSTPTEGAIIVVAVAILYGLSQGVRYCQTSFPFSG